MCKKEANPLAQGCKITHGGTVITRATCRVRDQTLRRIFGGRPVAEFDELTTEEQDHFYQTC
eukprot:7767104-Pyramimonas_sp.AAC.1